MVAALAVLSLPLAGCSRVQPTAPASTSTFVSYAEAAGLLRGLQPADADEQLRDLARTGLATQLEFTTAQLRDAAFDTVPVRDAGFADLSRQPTGPGRALFDGRVLHLLVPKDDPHRARTVGLLIDQHRIDAGADPEQVRIHQYQIHPGEQTIELIPENPLPARDIRSANGYVSMRVDQEAGLKEFLGRTNHLSTLERRGTEIWAGGWHWPDVSAAPLDYEDVSAIQRGYVSPDSKRRPGFSLDPGPLETAEDVRAVVPGLSAEWAEVLIEHWLDPIPEAVGNLAAVVNSALFHNDPPPEELKAAGLPSTRVGLWALNALLRGQPVYSEARYDGKLAGTKVGMTLFYTDHIAKNWTAGVGDGLPSKAVPGFIPDTEAVIPWGHCKASDESAAESGRLWFGQSDSGFDFSDDRVTIGAQATRLFARSDGQGDTEVEPSFGFGRGLRWWDEHFQAVADYEPQYQRLDQIMRWSGALEWLSTKTSARLPQLADTSIRSDLRFRDWYPANKELRERSPVTFVTPPSAKQESIQHIPSKDFESCGRGLIQGGVSLGDVLSRKGTRTFRPAAAGPVRRAGVYDEASTFNPATGAGKFTEVSLDNNGKVAGSLQRTITPGKDGSVTVGVAGGGRRVAPFGGLKVWRAETAGRALTVTLKAEKGKLEQGFQFQQSEVGTLSGSKQGNLVVVQWRRGMVDRFRRALESVQQRFVSQPGAKGLTPRDGPLFRYLDGNGHTYYKVDAKDWFEITDRVTPPGDGLAFRIGRLDQSTKNVQFYLANPSRGPPELLAAPAGEHWTKFTPSTGTDAAHAGRGGAPPASARQIRVSTPDGKATTTVYQSGPDLWFHHNDAILGQTVEGSAFARDFFAQVDSAMKDAGVANDGLLRAVPLGGDGVAFVSAKDVILAPAGHPWVEQSHAFAATKPVLVRIQRGIVVPVGVDGLVIDPGWSPLHAHADHLASLDSVVYVDEATRSLVTHDDGRVVADALPGDRRVVIVRATTKSSHKPADLPPRQPDIWMHNGQEWSRAGGSGGGQAATTATRTVSGGPTITSTAPPPSGAPAPGGSGSAASGPEVYVVIYLVCLDDNTKSAARCGQ